MVEVPFQRVYWVVANPDDVDYPFVIRCSDGRVVNRGRSREDLLAYANELNQDAANLPIEVPEVTPVESERDRETRLYGLLRRVGSVRKLSIEAVDEMLMYGYLRPDPITKLPVLCKEWYERANRSGLRPTTAYHVPVLRVVKFPRRVEVDIWIDDWNHPWARLLLVYVDRVHSVCGPLPQVEHHFKAAVESELCVDPAILADLRAALANRDFKHDDDGTITSHVVDLSVPTDPAFMAETVADFLATQDEPKDSN